MKEGPHWSARIWDMFVDTDYAKHTGKPPYWVMVIFMRYCNLNDKWYGL